MKNKELYEFVEKRLGKQLTKKDIALLSRWEKVFIKNDAKVSHEQTATLSKWHTTRSIIIRYGMTALISIVICLSIVLPIKLSSGKNPKGDGTETPPPLQEITRYTRSFSYDINYDTLSKYGFLLFHEEKGQIDDTEKSYIEYTTKKPGLPLSYLVKESLVVINDSEPFRMDYRIRTYKYYDFEIYYPFYATLENLHDTNVISDKQNFVNVSLIYAKGYTGAQLPPIDVSAFKIKEIPVFCHVRPSGAFAYIYFVYDDNEYMITLEDEYELGLLDAEYIKDHFIRTLFDNIKSA